MAFRPITMTDPNFEYEAPHFFDFTRVHEENSDESDYFSMCNFIICIAVVILRGEAVMYKRSCHERMESG